jgi:GNAT superfamily N-acetyltransferase
MMNILRGDAAHPRREVAKTKKGRLLQIRHMAAADTALLVDLFSHMSPETRRLRFMGALGNLPEERIWSEARQLATIDPARAAALVATVRDRGRERIVGVARLHHDIGRACAEVALVVRDDYQNEGVGSILFGRLAQLAHRRGLSCLEAFMLAENTTMRRLMQATGPTVSIATLRGETTMTIEISSQ